MNRLKKILRYVLIIFATFLIIYKSIQAYIIYEYTAEYESKKRVELVDRRPIDLSKFTLTNFKPGKKIFAFGKECRKRIHYRSKEFTIICDNHERMTFSINKSKIKTCQIPLNPEMGIACYRNLQKMNHASPKDFSIFDSLGRTSELTSLIEKASQLVSYPAILVDDFYGDNFYISIYRTEEIKDGNFFALMILDDVTSISIGTNRKYQHIIDYKEFMELLFSVNLESR
jgi:hypothetical protein